MAKFTDPGTKVDTTEGTQTLPQGFTVINTNFGFLDSKAAGEGASMIGIETIAGLSGTYVQDVLESLDTRTDATNTAVSNLTTEVAGKEPTLPPSGGNLADDWILRTTIAGVRSWAAPPTGGEGGAVDSVNGFTGVVTLNATNIPATVTGLTGTQVQALLTEIYNTMIIDPGA